MVQIHLLRLEEEDGAVAQVEVDEMFRLCCFLGVPSVSRRQNSTVCRKGRCRTVRDKASKVATDDAVPRWALPVVKGLLDMLRNVLRGLACQLMRPGSDRVRRGLVSFSGPQPW